MNDYFKSTELTFVGHSLGGGLANLSALKADRASVTFNPAWLSKATMIFHGVYSTSSDKLTNYVIFGEILDAAQRSMYLTSGGPFYSILEPRGMTRYLFSAIVGIPLVGPAKAHMIDKVIGEIEDVDNYNTVWDEQTGTWVIDKK